MLTQKDLEEVKKIVKEEVKYLPSKEDFATRMDEMMGELKAIREEQTLISGQLSEHSDRFEKIDKHLGISTA